MNKNMKKNLVIGICLAGVFFAGMFVEGEFDLSGKTVRVLHKIGRTTTVFKHRALKSASDFVGRSDPGVLADFELQSDLGLWEDSAVEFDRSQEHAFQGQYSLKVVYPGIDYPGLNSMYRMEPFDWNSYRYMKLDVYNPGDSLEFYVIIKGKDNKSYSGRSDQRYTLSPGWNHLVVDLHALKVNQGSEVIPPDSIIQYVFALGKNYEKRALYLDNIHLETAGEAEKKLGKPEVVVDAGKSLEPINPLIFGTNFEPETTDAIAVRDFAKDSGITMFRFPGGDAPGYHWKTGTFDYRTDKPHMFPFAKYDTVAGYAKAIGAQLVIQINLESGTSEEAAEWVKYTNKELGFYVKYWELGNEPYGNWDKSHRSAEEYAKDLKEYSQAMKAVDPTIKLGAAWGGDYFKDWDKIILTKAGNYIDFLSIHWYPNHTGPGKKYNGKPHPDDLDVAANAFKVPEIVNRMKDMIGKYAPERKGKIEFSFLEWDGAWDAPSYNPEPYAQGIAQWSLANGLFFAETFGQFAKEGVALATSYKFQETPFGYIRGHFTEKEEWNVLWDKQTVRPKALAHKMFARYFGDVLVEGHIEHSPEYVKAPDWYDASYAGQVPYLSLYASKNAAGDKLYVMLINRHPDQAFPVKIDVRNFEFDPMVIERVLTGPQITSQNDGSPGLVAIHEQTVETGENPFTYICPPHAVVSLEMTRK